MEKYDEGVKLKEVPVPKPGPKEVLVKVECAPLMTLDRLLAFGKVFPTPYVFGAQASGTVVELGPDCPKDLLGKKVHLGCSLLKLNLGTWQGLWTQYKVHPVDELYVYDQKLSHETACSMYGTPLTAWGLYRKTKSFNPKCIVVTPGASYISKIVTNLAMKDGIKVINVVRSDESASLLKEKGYQMVLNSSDPKFWDQFKELVAKHAPSVMVDAVAGELSTKMFLQMPPKATLVVYGALGGDQVLPLPVFPLVMADKTVTGYYWSAEDFYKPKEEVRKELDMVNKDLVEGGKIFGAPVVKKYKMEEYMKAITEQPSFASKGAGIIMFH